MADVVDLTSTLEGPETERVISMIHEALNQLPELARTRAFNDLTSGEASEITEEGDTLVFSIGETRFVFHQPDGLGDRVEAEVFGPELRVVE